MQQNFPSTITKKHRACLSCSIVLTSTVFKREGCPNCPFLEMKNNPENMTDATSDSFKGLICLTDPKQSWVAKWQRLNEFCPGVYATLIEGVLPDEFINRIEENGRIYWPRDKSFSTQ